MNHSLTLMPFLLALFVGVAAQGLNVYQVNAWNVGTLEIEPWRQRSSAAARGVAAAFSWMRLLRSRLFRLSVALAMALMVAHVADAGAHGVLLAIVPGTVDFAEVKDAIEKSNRAFEEYKRTNDERLKQIAEKGVADPLLNEKMDKLEADIAKHSAIADSFARLEARVNRLQLGGGESDEAKSADRQVKQFNGMLRAIAGKTGRAVVEVTVDQFKAYKAAFNSYLRRGEQQMLADEQRAMSVGSDPDGGYVVHPDMNGQVVKKAFETSPVRQICAQQTISTDALEGLIDKDEASFGWVSESGTRSTSGTPTLGKWRIPVHEAYSNPGATQSLLDDANIDVEAWLSGKVGDKIGRGFNTSFVVGTGVGQPRGFASYTTAATADASRAWGTLEHVATGTSGGFGTDPNGSDKLIDLVHKLNSNYRSGAYWVMNRRTLGSARKLKDSSGGAGQGSYIWLPSLAAGQLSTLLGYPVLEADDMTDLGANSLSIAFGNFLLGYQIVDRIGIRVLRDPYTNKPFVQFYTTARVGGDVINFDAIKFIKFI